MQEAVRKGFGTKPAYIIEKKCNQLHSLAFWGWIFLCIDIAVFAAHLIAITVADGSKGSNQNDLLVGLFVALHTLITTPVILDIIQNCNHNVKAMTLYSHPYEPPKRSSVVSLFCSLWFSVLTTAFAYKFKSNLPQRWLTIVVDVWQVVLFAFSWWAYVVNTMVQNAPGIFEIFHV
jgi:hypothetical protein